MFESHFGLRENPFVAAHQSKYIYPSPEHQEALAHLRYGIENREPFVIITGEVGTGKTTALYDALAEWQDRAVVGLITNSSLTRAELLEEIALRLGLGLAPGASKPQIMVQLERHLLAIHGQGHRAILLLDESQNLERDLLEEIRLLSNLEVAGDKLVQIFLVGQPELEERLMQTELRQLRQRVAVHYRIQPLSRADTERYIHHRIAVAGGHGLTIFPPAACTEVHRLTHGIPREINHLCTQSLVNAFVEEASGVGIEHVRMAAEDLDFKSVLSGATAAPKKDWTRDVRTESQERADAQQIAKTRADAEAKAPAAGTPGESPTPTDPRRWTPEPIEEKTDAPTAEATPPSTVPARAPRPAPASSDADWQNWFDTLADTGEQPAEKPASEPNPAPVAKPATPAAAYAAVQQSGETPAAAPATDEPEPPMSPRFEDALRQAEALIDEQDARAAAARASDARAEEAARAALPPRLRAKLEDSEERRAGGSSTPVKLMIGVAVLAVIVVGAALAQRFVSERTPTAKATSPTTESAPTVPGAADHTTADLASTPDPGLTPKPAAAQATQQQAPRAAAAPTPAEPEPTPTEIPEVRSASTPAATASESFALAVGAYLYEDRAQAEVARLASGTRHRSRIVTIRQDGVSMYRVVIGAFPDRGAAERAASDLIQRGLVDEARVIAAN